MPVTRRHLAPLTSLRLFAAGMIVLLHLRGRFGLPELLPGVSLGQGVAFFFVLSGFILTYVYYESDNKYFNFIKNRVFRIYPLHYVTLIAALIFSPLATTDFVENPWSIVAQLLLLQSFFGDTQYAMSYNGVAWSISTEIGFYLVFPFILKYINRVGIIFLALSFALILFGLIMHSAGPSTAEYFWEFMHVHPVGRLPEFLAGAFAARVFLRNPNWMDVIRHQFGKAAPSGVELATLLICVALLATWAHLYPISAAIFNEGFAGYVRRGGMFAFFAVLVFVFAFGSGALSSALSHPFLVFLGEISFALYLVHQIVIRALIFNHDIVAAFTPLETFILVVSISLLLSALCYKLIEDPARLLHTSPIKNTWEKFKSGSRYSVKYIASILIITSFVYVSFLRGYSSPSETWLNAFENSGPIAQTTYRNSAAELLGVTPRATGNGLCLEALWSTPITDDTRGLMRHVRIFDESENMQQIAAKMLVSTGARSREAAVQIRDSFCIRDRIIREAGAGGEIRIMVRKKVGGWLVNAISSADERVIHVAIPLSEFDDLTDQSELSES